MIGIDPNTGLCYEGVSRHGYGLWPTPLLLRATFVLSPEDWSQVPASGDLKSANCVFREDFFDPVTRIRRGRFYDIVSVRSQPDEWYVHKHPSIPEEVAHRNHQGLFSKSLLNYSPMYRFSEKLQQSRDPLVVLGAQPAVTAWSVISVERAGGEMKFATSTSVSSSAGFRTGQRCVAARLKSSIASIRAASPTNDCASGRQT